MNHMLRRGLAALIAVCLLLALVPAAFTEADVISDFVDEVIEETEFQLGEGSAAPEMPLEPSAAPIAPEEPVPPEPSAADAEQAVPEASTDAVEPPLQEAEYAEVAADAAEVPRQEAEYAEVAADAAEVPRQEAEYAEVAANAGKEVRMLTVRLKDGHNPTKVHDRNIKADMSPSDFELEGVAEGDTVTISKVSAYYDDASAGTRSVTVSFELDQQSASCTYGLESMSIVVEGTITPKDLADSDIRASIGGGYYTGQPIEPNIYLYYDTYQLTHEYYGDSYIDYVISCSNNINVGTATATLTGQGNYTGTRTIDFTIEPRYIGDASFGPTQTCIYTGAPVEPDYAPTYNNVLLIKDVDYTVTYEINTNITGSALAYFTGIGNFSGRHYEFFKIVDGAGKADRMATVKFREGHNPSKVYDGGTAASLSAEDFELVNVAEGDAVTFSVSRAYYDLASAGDRKVMVRFQIDQQQSASYNYILANPAMVIDGTITKKTVTITPSPRNGKTYGDQDNEYYDWAENGRLDGRTTGALAREPGEDAGLYSYTLGTLDAGVNYALELKPEYYVIHPANISNVRRSWRDGQSAFDYTGSAVEPELSMEYWCWNYAERKDVLICALEEEVDYTVAYADNIDAGNGRIIVSGIGNFTGTFEEAFHIQGVSVYSLQYESIPMHLCTGSAIEPEVSLSYDGQALVKDVDYTVAYADNIEIGEAVVTVTGKGRYEGARQFYFTITDAFDIGMARWASIPEQAYTGAAIEPALTLTYGDRVLVAGVDYEAAYSDNVEFGTARVTVTGMGDFKGTRTGSFRIVQGPRTDREVTVSLRDDCAPHKVYDGTRNCVDGEDTTVTRGLNASDFAFDGVAEGDTVTVRSFSARYQSPDVSDSAAIDVSIGISYNSFRYNYILKNPTLTVTGKITRKNMVVTPVAGQSKEWGASDPDTFQCSVTGVFSSDRDQISGRLGREPGEDLGQYGYTIGAITGGNNYQVALNQDATFEIRAKRINASDVTVAAIQVQQYTGNPITPEVTLTYMGRALVKDTDYTVAYSNNIEGGLATITVTGQGNFTGVRTISFTIMRPSSESTEPMPACEPIAAQQFTGAQIRPAVTMRDGEYALVEGVDYELLYSENLHAGFGYVNIRGIGSYEHRWSSASFRILPTVLPIPEAIPDQIYTGAELDPPVTITFNGAALAEGFDYVATYVNNVGPGTATVYTVGIGDFAGSRLTRFQINDEHHIAPSPTPTATPEPSPTPTPVIQGIYIEPMNPGPIALKEKAQLTVKATDPAISLKKVKWTSSDKKVASVSSKGVVTGKKAGTATITATTGNDLRATVSIEVRDIYAPTSLKLTPEGPLTMAVKAKMTVTPVMTSESGKVKTKLKWTSSDKKIASVSSKGVVTGKKAGTATITVTTGNGLRASVDVTVN